MKHNYLEKRALYPPMIKVNPAEGLGMVVVIPAHNEAHIISTLESLYACELPEKAVEVIVLINQHNEVGENIAKVNQTAHQQVLDWSARHSKPDLTFYPIFIKDLPKKYAGVGLARKIGLDEACFRFQKANKGEGVLVCFDADSQCATNYLREIEGHFAQNSDLAACSIYFEHPLEGDGYDIEVYEAIAKYELHLRYYINMQRFIGFPFAYQTIGSSMAVRLQDYMAQGGMNKRKAGEDFYFLHKFIELGRFNELNTTKVIPSPRISDRVPFGTGRAMMELMHKEDKSYLTYHFNSFLDLAPLFNYVNQLVDVEAMHLGAVIPQLSNKVQSFMLQVDLDQNVKNIIRHTSSIAAFRHRFYRWFNAFVLMKYLHYMRDEVYPNIEVDNAARWFLNELSGKNENETNTLELLRSVRAIDVNSVYFPHGVGVPM